MQIHYDFNLTDMEIITSRFVALVAYSGNNSILLQKSTIRTNVLITLLYKRWNYLPFHIFAISYIFDTDFTLTTFFWDKYLMRNAEKLIFKPDVAFKLKKDLMTMSN